MNTFLIKISNEPKWDTANFGAADITILDKKQTISKKLN